jgi:hypothetical protein
MSEQSRIAQSVMEGGGAYNQHAKHQTAAASAAGRFLERAVDNLVLDQGAEPIVIADYGSSQGKNSQGAMRAAIRTLRPRLEAAHPIFVYHIDQPSNDFNSLFENLAASESYARSDAALFPCAIGRSFYENVLPSGSVHVGWSSYAAVWLSKVPAPIPGDLFCSAQSAPAARAAFERQAASDWRTFLSLRSTELRAGGCLVVALPGRDDDGKVGVENLFLKADETLAQMIDEGTLSAGSAPGWWLAVTCGTRASCLRPLKTVGNSSISAWRISPCLLSRMPPGNNTVKMVIAKSWRAPTRRSSVRPSCRPLLRHSIARAIPASCARLAIGWREASDKAWRTIRHRWKSRPR